MNYDLQYFHVLTYEYFREAILNYLVYFILALMSCIILIKPTLHIAKSIGFVEKPRPDIPRKIHTEPKPYLASIPLFVVYWSFMFIAYDGFNVKSLTIFLSSVLIILIGLVDDYYKIKNRDLSAFPKLIGQLLACVLLYYVGIRFVGFTSPFSGDFILLPQWIQFIFTSLWIFGIITIINFTDGMDGLAGGISFIASISLFAVALIMGDVNNALSSIVLSGVCLGYLRYNKFPSTILMGDSGATFIGLILATISLDGVFKQATVISIIIPFLIFGLPIFDNLYVMFLRYKNKQPLHIGDSNQMHFRLHLGGMSQKLTVYFMYLISMCLSLVAIILVLFSKFAGAQILLGS
jgi:UDP-N-acetylmuramyl pentapeptide phosphotransferase/UDP-N-acetylglucosamine-1-phosphate transferase